MEHNKAYRAAETITKLLRAHVDDTPSDIDIHECIAVRDDIRALAKQMDPYSKYELPEVGDTMYDNRCPVDIVEVTDYPASLYHIREGTGPTVAEYKKNQDDDPNAPVVKVTYPGTDKVYAVPVTRLTFEQD